MAGPMVHQTNMTPTQAAQALHDLEYSEESLSARVGGLTCMVWGIVSAAIFVSYGVAIEGELPWIVFPFLWAPWVMAGSLATNSLWRLHALAMRRPHDKAERRRWALGMTLLFGTAIIVLAVLRGAGSFAIMTAVNGLAAIGIFAALSVRRKAAAAAWPLVVAGGLMFAAAGILWGYDFVPVYEAFIAAGVCGIGLLFSGLYAFVRG